MKYRKILLPATLLLITSLGIAYAGGSSSATITSDKDGAWGPYFTLEDNRGWSTASTWVSNYDSSTNTLWAAGQSSSGNEFCNASARPGATGSQSAKDIAGGRYRVVLDPSGPLAKGCNGEGSHQSDEGR